MKLKLLSIMLATVMVSSCLQVVADEQREVRINLSEIELQEIFRNPTRSYVYVGREVSDIADLMEEIGRLDNNPESFVHGLRNHIARGFNIGNYDSVAQALEWAESVLNQNRDALSEERAAVLTRSLNNVIEQVINEQLNLDAEILSFMRDSVAVDNDTTRSSSCCHPNGLRLLVIKEKLDVLGKARFFNDVTFKEDVRFRDHVKFEDDVKFKDEVVFEDEVFIEDTLSVADAIIACDLTVGCNISLNDSVDGTVGNIIKDGLRFIHTFPAGSSNTFVGQGAGNFTMTGDSNSGFGENALLSNTGGNNNTALGNNAMIGNSTGSDNVAVGNQSMQNNTSGSDNVAVGVNALLNNTTGTINTAVGLNALANNTIGDSNNAVGAGALVSNTTGVRNVAMGVNALQLNTTGHSNTAIGDRAVQFNVGGVQNSALGRSTLAALTTGSNNIAIGFTAGGTVTTGSGNIYIDADATAAAEAATTRIGTAQTRMFVAGVRGVATGVADAIAVLIDSNGQLGTVSSSINFKHDVQDMGDRTASILDLRPVTFVYNDDASETLQYGLIAEEVAEIFPDIVVNDEDGHPFTVQYHVLPALLLNEMKKLAARVAALEARQ